MFIKAHLLHHRIGGLETYIVLLYIFRNLHHRIGGLEILTLKHLLTLKLHHRIGGLEILIGAAEI